MQCLQPWNRSNRRTMRAIFGLGLSMSLLLVARGDSSEASCVWEGLQRDVDPLEDSLETLSNEFLQVKLKFNPVFASTRGFHQFDTLLPSYNEECYLALGQACDVLKDRVDGINDHQNLTRLNKLYLDTIKWECQVYQDGLPFKGYLFPPIGHLEGLQSGMRVKLNKDFLYDFQNVTDLEKPLIRLKKLPKLLKDIEGLMKAGIDAGITMAEHNFESHIKDQFHSLYTTNPEESSYYQPFVKLQSDSGSEEVGRIQNEAKEFITQELQPALKSLENEVLNEYVNFVRTTDGILSLPNGKELYQKCLEFHTSVDGITAEEIHQIGLDEVAEIRSGVLAVMRNLSLDMSFGEFVQYVQESPGQQFNSSEDLLAFVTNMLTDDINPKIVAIFPPDQLSTTAFNPLLEAIPPGQGGIAYYESGSADGKRPGTISLGLNNLEAIKKFELRSLIMHEGNPGHNLHSAFLETFPLPPHMAYPIYGRLGSSPSNFPFYTSLTEGWGLYSEWLGIELGLYQDPFDLVGYYSWGLLRASRLVVDTGIHHFGWTRAKAVDYVVENTFLSQTVSEGQVDRYIDWPGQSTAYKIGERFIRQIRKKYSDRLGDQLALPEFHKRLLSCPVPFSMLEECLQIQDEVDGDPTKPK